MTITESKKFKVAKIDKSTQKRLEKIVSCLKSNQKVPENFNDHKLDGSLSGYRICHVKYDTILLYQKTDTNLNLIDIGTHRSVFKSNTFGLSVSHKKAKRIVST